MSISSVSLEKIDLLKIKLSILGWIDIKSWVLEVWVIKIQMFHISGYSFYIPGFWVSHNVIQNL